MPVSTDPYSEHSETIEAVLAHVGRRHRLSSDALDEFSSWARLRLIEHDFAILRKFRGQSSFRTFLLTVTLRLFLDWRNQQWGRWRPSSLARRLGPIATELERIVLRDGTEYESAVEMLMSIGAVASRDECDATWAQLRRQPRRRVLSSDDVVDLPSAGDPYAQTDFVDPRDTSRRVGQALRQALRSLDHQDQILLRLSYLDEFTAKEMAARMEVEAKPLYRKVEQIRVKLGRFLEAAGLTKDDTLAAFQNPELDLGEILDQELRKPKAGPSTEVKAGGEA